LIPCLISGNAALIKPSDFNPYLFPYLSSLSDSNLPVSNLITNIYIEPSQLYLLRSFRKLKKIIFSGSHSSARHIFEVVV
jgi:acyl-CoA reductase-like NAD-dependent aldehyde dehydrogenase